MTGWEYTSEKMSPGENRYDVLHRFGAEGWEAWYIEKDASGWREIYFKSRTVAFPVAGSAGPARDSSG